MKQSLVKQTSNAIKTFQNHSDKGKQTNRKQLNQKVQKQAVREDDTEHVKGEPFLLCG